MRNVFFFVKNSLIRPITLDLLLPITLAFFLNPINPLFSASTGFFWLVIQLLSSPNNQRWALWPLLFLLLLMSRTWLLNESSSVVSSNDFLLIIIAMLAASSIPQERWTRLIKLILMSLPIIGLNLGHKPWQPNPSVGVNEGAYLLGLFLVLALCWLNSTPNKRERLLAGLTSFLATILVWQAGSRAALLASSAAILIVISQNRSGSLMEFFKRLLLPISGLISTIILLSTISNRNFISDLGRLQIFKCYASIPLSGNNRALYGIGFFHKSSFCQNPVSSGMLSHAHNLYLQLWANTGLLGLLSIAIFAVYLWIIWRSANLPPILKQVGLSVLVYLLLINCFDVSLFHWPVTQIFTGIFLAIPMSRISSTVD